MQFPLRNDIFKTYSPRSRLHCIIVGLNLHVIMTIAVCARTKTSVENRVVRCIKERTLCRRLQCDVMYPVTSWFRARLIMPSGNDFGFTIKSVSLCHRVVFMVLYVYDRKIWGIILNFHMKPTRFFLAIFITFSIAYDRLYANPGLMQEQDGTGD